MGNPLVFKSVLPSNNADEIKESGWYECLNMVENMPEDWCYLFVYKMSTYNFIIQHAINNESGGYYFRKCYAGSWIPWQRIDNFGCNSLAELAGGVAGEMAKLVQDSDANDIQTTGFYYMVECSNTPNNYFYMMVLRAPGVGDFFQFGFGIGVNKLYVRYATANGWSDWATI